MFPVQEWKRGEADEPAHASECQLSRQRREEGRSKPRTVDFGFRSDTGASNTAPGDGSVSTQFLVTQSHSSSDVDTERQPTFELRFS